MLIDQRCPSLFSIDGLMAWVVEGSEEIRTTKGYCSRFLRLKCSNLDVKDQYLYREFFDKTKGKSAIRMCQGCHKNFVEI